MRRVVWSVVAALCLMLSLPATAWAADELAGKTVVVWAGSGVYTSGEEFTNIRQLLEDAGATFVTASKTGASDLEAALADADVFILPEAENASSTNSISSLGTTWSSVLEAFLERGRIVIGASTYGGISVLRGAGLTTAEYGGSAGEVTVDLEVAPTYPLAVTKTFPSPSATSGLINVDEEAQIWATESGYGRPVAARLDKGTGIVVLLSFDFFKAGTSFSALLVNACLLGASSSCPSSISVQDTLAGMEEKPLGCVQVSRYVRSIGLSLTGQVEISVRATTPTSAGDSPAFLTFSATDGGCITIAPPLLKTGTWHFTASSTLPSAEAYAFVAMPFPMLVDLESLRWAAMGTVQDLPISLFDAQLSTTTGRLDVAQYYVHVGADTTGLQVRLNSDGSGKVYVRYAQPVDVVAGTVIADASAATVGNEAVLSIAGAFLQAGDYYIAVEQATTPSSYEVAVLLSP